MINLADLPTPTGTVEFQVSFNGGAYVVYDTQTLVGGTATSILYTPLAAGNYEFQAVYSGDVNFAGSISIEGSEPLTVGQAASTTTTLLSSDIILLGDLVYDTATVTGQAGLPTPTGTVDFEVSFNGGAWILFDTQTLSAGSAISIEYIPSAAGNYNFRAVYSGDSIYAGSQSGDTDEPLAVGLAPTFTTTYLGVVDITLGQSVTDNATVINLADLTIPTGTVEFQVSFNGGAFVTYDTQTLVGGTATSILYTPLAAGNYEFQAVYGGDTDFAGSTSIEGSEPLIVGQAASYTTTLLSSDNVPLGDSVYDTATVAGLGRDFPVPTGTVDFQVSFNGGAYVVYDTQTLVGGTATSILYTPLAAGNYEFQAVYGGDSNYIGSMSVAGDEPLTVGQAASTTTTLLSSDNVPLGDSVYDTATVTGPGGFPVPTGTVDFEVSFNGGAWILFDTETLVDGGATSMEYVPAAIGNYNFRAIYSGDANNLPSQSGDADEPLSVGLAPSFTITYLGVTTISLGQSVTDNATVINLADLPTPTGTVDFQVSFNGGLYVVYDANVVLINGMAVSIGYTPLMAGNYEFQAVYRGDANFAGSTSIEGSEPLEVSKAMSQTSTNLGVGVITLGQSVTDNATVTGLGGNYPTPTGNIDFQVSFNAGPWTTFSTMALAVGSALSEWYLPLAAGNYEFRAVYQGDGNYLGSTSDVGSEPLTVEVAASTTTTYIGVESITLGRSVTDNATVVGLGDGFPVPTGTVEFQVSFNCGPWETFDSETLSEGMALSAHYTPCIGGIYHFRAMYLGDTNYAPSESGLYDEPLIVRSAGICMNIVLGQSVTDNATVIGLGGDYPVPTGTVDFQVRYEGGPWVTFDHGVVLVNGNARSDWYTPMAVGHYNFRALYSGDSNYQPSQSGDDEEPLCVSPAPTTTTTMLSAERIVLSQSVIDQATVTGLGGDFPVPTGTVTFQVKICDGPWTTFNTQTLTNGVATSICYKPLWTGTYHFRAIYSGDANYLGSQSNDCDEPLEVVPPQSQTCTDLGVDTITLGQSVTDNATVTGKVGLPTPTGTVKFQVKFNGGAWVTFDACVSLVNGKAISKMYTPLAAGCYYFRAVFCGDGMYLGSHSGDYDEPLDVDPAQSQTITDLGVCGPVIVTPN